MGNLANRFTPLLVVQLGLIILGPTDRVSATLNCRSESAVANGKMLVCWKQPTTRIPKHLLIHFHGANTTVQDAFERSQLDAVLVIVNLPGLSAAYSKPFVEDAGLFEEILARAKRALPQDAVDDQFDWHRVSLSSFSAGYGAVREILKSTKHFHQIDDIVVADSIYAGLRQKEPVRRVDEKNMRDFQEFARQAVDSKKRFTISHSSQSTPYASTTETADYLLRSLNIERRKGALTKIDAMPQSSHARSGQLVVLGFDGVTGQAHMKHLQHIDLFWNTITTSVGVAPQQVSSENAAAQSAARKNIDYAAAIEKLKAAIQYEVEQKQLPAFSISLVDHNRVVWADGFGFQDAQKEKPATAKTVYRVGSISKLFTDIAVLQLVEDGKLDLDVPVVTYLPEFKPTNPSGIALTLRQLMSHRSGLVRESPVGNYFDPNEPTLSATVASLNKTALVYKPETKTKYSNAAIAVVGAVLEKQLDVSHPQRVRATILDPLQMGDSNFVATAAIEPNLATGWMRTYDNRTFEAPTFLLGTGPAGNLYSNMLDLSRFLTCLFDAGKTADGRIFQPETFELMTTPIEDADGTPQGFGLGFHITDLDGHKQIGHGGAVYGFSTQLEALPDRKLGVAAASSLDGSNGVVRRLVNYALRLMLAAQDGKPAAEYRRTSPIPPERTSKLVGTYREVDGDRFARISELNGDVFLHRGEFRYQLRAADDDGQILVDDEIGFGTEVKPGDGDGLTVGEISFNRLPDTTPADIPNRWRGLIGEYGWDHNTLYILEENGQLYALIEWFYYYPLKEVDENVFEFPGFGLYHGEGLKFTRNADDVATDVVAAEVRFVRRETGTQDGETFKIEPLKPIDELRSSALAATPPVETGDFRDTNLVDLTTLDPTIKLDIRYASTNNFMGTVFYKQPRAFMQRPGADAVVRANKRLKDRGLGLLVHDAYRPWHVTKMFWDATPDELKDFVANPANGSRHNRGCAVDITLYDLASNEPIQMVAGYDEFSPRSFPLYPGGTSRQRWYRELLRRTMEAEGFTIYEFEWWHFDFKDWKQYRIGNVTFEEVSKE